MFLRVRLGLTRKKIGLIVLGSFLLAFGITCIHEPAKITEGGILGLILILKNQFGFTPALVAIGLNVLSYLLAYRLIGKKFILISAVSVIPFSFFLWLFRWLPLELSWLASHPLLASISAGLIVGLGVGLVIQQGGSTGGDDALAFSLTKVTGLGLGWTYFLCDLVILGLSLTYLPIRQIGYSVLTVAVSSVTVDRIK